MADNAKALADELAELSRRLDGVERTDRIAHSTIDVAGEPVPVPSAISQGVEAAEAIPGIQAEIDAAQAELQTALAEAQVALDEAALARSEAAQAVADAQAAVTASAGAVADALAAASAATAAQTTADGKNRVVRASTDAASPDDYRAGDQWWKYSGSEIVGLWIHSGSAWIPQTLTDAVITNLNAGTITAGTLSADRIGAGSIVADKLAANAVTADKINASAVIADKIAANAVTAVKIAASAVTSDKINAGAVVADKIAANAVTADKIQANAIDGKTITGATIRTAATGQRVQLDSDGLRAFDTANVEKAKITAAGGGLSLYGGITVADYVTESGSGPGYLGGDGVFLNRSFGRGQRALFGNTSPGGSVTTVYAGAIPFGFWIPNEIITGGPAITIHAETDTVHLNAANVKQGDSVISPIGAITQFAGATAPTGWLLCEGQAVSRSTYASLFAVIGTTYGAGDGSTTFNIPDMRGRMPVGCDSTDTNFNNLNTPTTYVGAKTHTLTVAQMPSHAHSQRFSLVAASGTNMGGMAMTGSGLQYNAEQVTTSSGGGGAHNNMPPYRVLNFIIRAI